MWVVRLGKGKGPSKPEPPTAPERSVSYSLTLGQGETLQTIEQAWHQARCLGVPDRAIVRIYSGMYSGGRVDVTFSWSEPMRVIG